MKVLAILVLLVVGCSAELGERYSVVVYDGCYTFAKKYNLQINIGWVSQFCYETEDEARTAMEEFIAYTKIKNHKKQDWIEIPKTTINED